MAQTRTDSLKQTGCDAFSIVEGCGNKNRHLLLLLWEGHPVDSKGTVKGHVTVLDAGTGDHAARFRQRVGETLNAEDLIAWLEQETGRNRMNTLHTNTLLVVGKPDPDIRASVELL